MHCDELCSAAGEIIALPSEMATGEFEELLKFKKWDASALKGTWAFESNETTPQVDVELRIVKFTAVEEGSDKVEVKLGEMDGLKVDANVVTGETVPRTAAGDEWDVSEVCQLDSARDFSDAERDTGDLRNVWHGESRSEKWSGKHCDAVWNRPNV